MVKRNVDSGCVAAIAQLPSFMRFVSGCSQCPAPRPKTSGASDPAFSLQRLVRPGRPPGRYGRPGEGSY
eukprot:5951938-Pyramimonas_sp.AAC.1